MPRMVGVGLSRREREILDVLHALKKASAAQVREHLAAPPTYSAVRSILRILEQKRYVRHEQQGKRYLYFPAVPRKSAARSAIRHVVRTFFGGSLESAVKTFLSSADAQVSQQELDSLAALIDRARK